jgi:hypothetical protein
MMAKSQEHDFVEAKQKALESVVLPILQNLSGGAEGGISGT